MYIPQTNDPTVLSDKHFTIVCPHCNTRSGVSLISPPRFEFLTRFRPGYVGMAYRCDACNEPIFLKFKVTSWGNPIHFEAQPIEIERARVAYELKYLPEEVKNDFSEALICYSQGCWNAFAAMCRRALQSAAMALGADGTTKITRQLDNLREMQVVSEEEFEQLKTIMITGHDGAHPHLPNINGDRAAVLLELMKDALTQLFVRKAKIEEASKLRAQATKQK